MKVEHIYTSSLPNKTLAESIAYLARVSNPSNQHNDATASKLVEYFEMFDMCLEIETSRAIAPQILRHRSFSFQEFSQRYAQAQDFEPIELRFQGDSKQGSSEVVKFSLPRSIVNDAIDFAYTAYNRLIKMGVSRETARMILPLATTTRLYMKGNIRSWIHYIQVRTHTDTQKEHREIAEAAKAILIKQFPQIEKHLTNE